MAMAVLQAAMPTVLAAEGSGTSDLIDVQALEPSLRVDIRYATVDNFTHRAIYPKAARCYLRKDVAQRLQAAQQALKRQGLGLKLWDCYRPLSAQRALWAVVPDARYVAPPTEGSRHNRGAAVDLTLVDAAGRELVMPTPYDDFSERAHRGYDKLPPEAKKNRALLESVLTQHGFSGLPTEWWHFDAADYQRYPLDDTSFEALAQRRSAASTK
jgi:D-alanyl-D-alanine dipeptidase